MVFAKKEQQAIPARSVPVGIDDANVLPIARKTEWSQIKRLQYSAP
jgi:hypothetical protein